MLESIRLPDDGTDTTKLRWGWRYVHADFTSSNGFRWPFPGTWAEAPAGHACTLGGACPSKQGDGICIAKHWSGASSGGYTSETCLLVAYLPEDVLGEEAVKLRVRRAWVADVFKRTDLIGPGANLYGANLTRANLTRANLYGANLTRANLTRANLYGANLYGANLYGANLTRADLTRANLYGADLDGADLTRADLDGADLTRANLYGANLYGANLYGANLTRANLTRANLYGARYDKYTTWPGGFDARARGAVFLG